MRTDLDVEGGSRFLTTGQRKYGGPPPNWEGNTPGNGCEVFCGKIPKDMYEDELIPLFEKCGKIWDLRLMMDPMTGTNRGYAFVTFTSRDAASNAVREVSHSVVILHYFLHNITTRTAGLMHSRLVSSQNVLMQIVPLTSVFPLLGPAIVCGRV